MFGTLRLNPDKGESPDFVERASGLSFSEMGSYIPPHAACDKCRALKMRCSGQRHGCNRCVKRSVACTYSPLESKEVHRTARARARKRRSRTASSSATASSAASLSPAQTTPADQPTPSSAFVVDTTCSGIDLGPPGFLSCLDPELLRQSSSSSLQNESGRRPSETTTNFSFPGFDVDNLHPRPVRDHGHARCEFLSLSLDTTETAAAAAVPLPQALWTPPASETATDPSSSPSPRSWPWELPATTPPTPTTPACCACLDRIGALLEDLENRIRDEHGGGGGGDKIHGLDAVLAWQKEACAQCARVLRCSACAPNHGDYVMLLALICDKMAVLSRKLVCEYVGAGAPPVATDIFAGGRMFVGDYEVDKPGERACIARHLIGFQAGNMLALVWEMQAHAAACGRQAHMVGLRNTEQQVVRILRGLSS